MIFVNYVYLLNKKKLPFPISTSSSNKIFDLLHMDIWGPLAITSVDGHRYFLTIVDDFSRHTWIFFFFEN